MSDRPLLMIPGPIEISDGVADAAGQRPPSHVAPGFIASFGRSLGMMRQVWKADADSQPFVVAGSGTLAMESAVCNLVDPGDRVLLVNTGYFSDRMAEMLARRGAEVTQVGALPGQAPHPDDIEEAAPGHDLLFATHVDTSTGVRVDAETLCGIATRHGMLTVFDGVCATAGERFEQAAWGADVYLTASQKAIGLPPGLALWVASARALEKRALLATPPPLSLDWAQWQPIMQAYEAGRGSYFATPATALVLALEVGLTEILAEGIDQRFARHAQAAFAMRTAWAAMGLELLPGDGLTANTLSAIRYPEGVGPDLPAAIKEHGAVVAGGLHPELKNEYFRVGHMGHTVERPEWLIRTIEAVGHALNAHGHPVDVAAVRRDVVEAIGFT